jgi:hypothetical protein
MAVSRYRPIQPGTASPKLNSPTPMTTSVDEQNVRERRNIEQQKVLFLLFYS